MPVSHVSNRIVVALALGATGLLALALTFGPALRSGWPLLGLVAAGLASGSVLWLWLHRSLAMRLKALGRAAEQHQLGNREVQFPEDGRTELAYIGRLLNSMVAELVQRNAQLRRSEAKFRVISEYSRDALTAVGPPDWHFVSVNRAALQLFGVADERTLLTMSPGDVSPENQPDGTPSAEAARIQVQKALSDGFADFDWTHIGPEGRLIPCRVHLVRFELDGQVLVQGTVRDMTETREAQERARVLQAQVQEAQKLEAVGRLAGGVAHDFNNMLSVISLQAELALSLLDSGATPRTQLEQICQVTDRTARLIQQLLAFSRRQNAAPRPLNLDDAVSESLNLLRPGLGEGMQLEWRPGAPQWHVRLDPVQIDQILTNLCSNARDACKGQGRIIISTSMVELDEAACESLNGLRPGPHVMLRVEDDGPGLSQTARMHVFEPFFTTKEIGRGTGLGLASVYGIVRQAHGDARVESEVDHGASFILYFPRHDAPLDAAAEVSAAPVAASETHQGRILLVEDQPELLAIYSESLQRAGYDVRAVANPAAALAVAAEPGAQFDLLLSDVVMPGMNGLRMAMELRSKMPGMRELFMSGYSTDAMEERGLDTRGAKILSKPFRLPDLLRAVKAAMQEESG